MGLRSVRWMSWILKVRKCAWRGSFSWICPTSVRMGPTSRILYALTRLTRLRCPSETGRRMAMGLPCQRCLELVEGGFSQKGFLRSGLSMDCTNWNRKLLQVYFWIKSSLSTIAHARMAGLGAESTQSPKNFQNPISHSQYLIAVLQSTNRNPSVPFDNDADSHPSPG